MKSQGSPNILGFILSGPSVSHLTTIHQNILCELLDQQPINQPTFLSLEPCHLSDYKKKVFLDKNAVAT